jgi:arginine repressor
MVNVMKINHITKGGKARYIVLSNNDIKPIPVSKSYFKNLVEKIDKYNSTVLVNRQEEAAETISEEVNTADAQ